MMVIANEVSPKLSWYWWYSAVGAAPLAANVMAVITATVVVVTFDSSERGWVSARETQRLMACSICSGDGFVRVTIWPAAQSFEPPSTAMTSPVIQRDASEARNSMTEATSSGWPMRLSDCIPITVALPASVLVKFDMSVSITPGATALTRMPRGPSAEARYFTSVLMAPLVLA